MLNSHEWLLRHDPFVNEATALLHRCEECVAHLEMFAHDQDAIDGLRASLGKIGELADEASIDAISHFTRQLLERLQAIAEGPGLSDQALLPLRQCCSLLAWQLELIDPQTGALPLDDDEQQQWLDALASLAKRDHQQPASCG